LPILTFYQKYGNILKLTGISAFVLIFSLVELYRLYRRRLAIRRERVNPKKRKSLCLWPIQVDAPRPGFLRSGEFYSAARKMQTRQESEICKPDPEKTISDTISLSGFPQLRYTPLNRPPEYLFLIDLPSYDDHFARFIQTIQRAMQNQGMFIKSFFYRNDPRICFKTESAPREYLSDIALCSGDSRLILSGSCQGLLDPLTGEPEKWTGLFETWRERAILTPVSTVEWGMREVVLARNFILLPATFEGFNALEEHFASFKPDLRQWVKKSRKEPALPRKSDDITQVKEYLGPDTFKWLCACAVYPELNWNLTLYLGMRFFKHALGDEKQVLRLIRLSWFRKGRIPENIRIALLSELDRKRLKAVRESVFDILKHNPPPKDSAAFDTYRLNLAVHKWMVSKDTRKELKQTISDTGRERVVRDALFLRLMEPGPGSGLILPKKLKKIFFRHGISFFGLKTRVRVLFAICIALAIFFAVPKPEPVPIVESITLEFAHVRAGQFMMGSNNGYDEKPVHKVKITKGFYMQKTEVTQGQWKAVMGNNPSYFQECGDDCPVETVSWNDVKEFLEELNKKAGKARYRLPTEAEWEYAARAGTRTKYFWGDEADCYKANYGEGWSDECEGINPGKTMKVGSFMANKWALHDMHGNVWEWVEDWYDKDFYKRSPPENPVNNQDGSSRVLRGGSWIGSAGDCRSAHRAGNGPGNRDYDVGFRVLRSLPL